MAMAKNATKETIASYFEELKKTLDKYNLMDAPHRIFNVDETSLSPEHKPPSVIGPRETPPPAITSPRSSTTTLISCCSATGQVIPPFFVFMGNRSTPDLMAGALPGSAHTMSDSGWSNSTIFENYLSEHFFKHITSGDDYTLVLYDGVTSHISTPPCDVGQRA